MDRVANVVADSSDLGCVELLHTVKAEQYVVDEILREKFLEVSLMHEDTLDGDASLAKRIQPSRSVGYQIFILVLSAFALAVAAALVVTENHTPLAELLEYADFAVCAVFLVDFVISFLSAPHRLRYLASWGWLDLLSSLPAVDLARWGRAARIFRVLRVLRAVRATRIVALLAMQHRARNAVLATALVLLLTIFCCSIAILHFEGDGQGNIHTAPDALWWAVATVTTVGYGDFYPVTWEGRIVAAVLMLTGVVVFSALAGAMSTLFLAPAVGREDREIQRLSEEVASLKRLMESNCESHLRSAEDDKD